MKEKIIETLLKLDPKNDNQWTQEGLPKVDILKFLSGGENWTRDQINEAAPGFTRSNTVIGGDENGQRDQVASQQSVEGEQGQASIEEPSSKEQKAEDNGTGTVEQPQAQTDQANVVTDERIGTRTGTMTVGVHVTFADALKSVLTELDFVDVKELDDEALQELADRHSDILSADNQFLSEVNEFVTKRALYLNKVVEERAKREPQQSQADVLAQFHERVFENQQNLPINKPRQLQARGPVYFGK